MASFAYTNNTVFQPFSLDEIIKPLAMATEAHEKTAEAYADLDTKANMIGSLANEANDPETYRIYTDYANRLRAQADALAANGLTPSVRTELARLKGDYGRYITPIQNAIQKRDEQTKELRQAILRDPTLLIQRDFNSLNPEYSLDRWLENPSYTYGDTYSGSLITSQVSDMAKHLSTQLRNIRTGKLDAYTNTFLRQYGLSPQEVLNAVNNPDNPNSSRVLNAIYDSVVQGIPQSIRDRYEDEIRNYATRGFWSALGKDEISTFNNYAARASNSSGSNQDSSRVLGPRISVGATGKTDEERKKAFEGFKRVSNSSGMQFSTNRLDRLKSQYDEASKKVANIPLEDREAYEAYLKTGSQSAITAPYYAQPALGLNHYSGSTPLSEMDKLYKPYLKAREELKKETERMREFSEKYSHLSPDLYTSMLMGNMLEDVQSKQNKSVFPMNADETQYNKMRSGVANIMLSLTEDELKRSKNIGLFDEKGKHVDYSDTKDLLGKDDNLKKLQISVVDEDGKIGLRLTKDGKRYSIKGIQQIDNFEKLVNMTNDFLKDFTKDGVKDARVDLGNGYTGLVMKDANLGYVKQIYDSNGNLMAENSLADELNGGANRDNYIVNLSNNVLTGIYDLTASDYK